ncbi:MBOAT family O-acyltransferase [Leptospira biflexa]|uniref:Putative poly(Beta-D-mannuronate) O-acetylase (Alginate biosynthesis protein AlgI) n=1 Tax=Leptospira biflexa serovar Patoc (strain Patoc 1 / ATCC 23582 / Paris) TaxID=456481 RepID=B0SSM0_LEPBP|nr:Putative poly(beta-D-mannuronate) O-acetylase (Alginate biosynthesis protein AlgI) [Leptospira biflexa serovar Patoc strain 'Patoc 1 (Paris)']
MIFSSPLFLFLFFPLVYLFYSVVSNRYKLLTLLFASIIFYYWGERVYIVVIFFSILINYFFAQLIEVSKRSRGYLILGILANLSLIIYFKYSYFLLSSLNSFIELNLEVKEVHLPLGISFFTFQGISYLVDVYRKDIFADRSFLRFSFYISFFPQLIAGPIVRYTEVFHSLNKLNSSLDDKIEGITTFIWGLAKKVVIANTLGLYADEVLNSPTYEFGSGVAWLAIFSYSFQIYFDFSGYSDMAIGLGLIFGIRFPKNFNHPYSALSFQDFWRRWHISPSLLGFEIIYIFR